MPASVQRGFSRSLIAGDARPSGLGADLGAGKGRCLVAGEWNSEIYEPLRTAALGDDDAHCAKNRMSGLWSAAQPLWRHLESERKKTVFFAGVNTDQCVLGTLSDAYNAGWDCVLVEDCCGTPTKGAVEVCLHNIGVRTLTSCFFSPLAPPGAIVCRMLDVVAYESSFSSSPTL